jgi:hypothetical protein
VVIGGTGGASGAGVRMMCIKPGCFELAKAFEVSEISEIMPELFIAVRKP